MKIALQVPKLQGFLMQYRTLAHSIAYLLGKCYTVGVAKLPDCKAKGGVLNDYISLGRGSRSVEQYYCSLPLQSHGSVSRQQIGANFLGFHARTNHANT